MKQILKHKAFYTSTMWTIICIWFKYYMATANHLELSIWVKLSLSELYPLESCSVGSKCTKIFVSKCLLWKRFTEYAISGWQMFCLSIQGRIPMSSAFCCYSWEISCQLNENYFYSSLLVLELLRFLSLGCSFHCDLLKLILFISWD